MTQLGIVTYNIAKDWDLPTILSRLEKLGYAGVELRTGHAHKVEVNLTGAQRDEVRKRFEDSPVHLAGLGSTFEYQSADPAIVRKNIEGTKEYVRLAHDVGSPGVKVRPNGIPQGPNLDETLRQIGRALHEIGEDATGFGIEIRVEVHGAVTQELKHFARILHYADHPNVHACWNSNPTDVESGSVNADICPGRLQGPRGAPPRPLRRLLPLARTLRPAGRPALRGFHPGRDPREYRSGASLALLQSPVAELSTRRSESLSPVSPLSGC